MSTRFFVFFFFVLSFYINSNAQNNNEQKELFREKIYYGGSFNASFGSLTFVNISPAITYRLSDRFEIGVGGIYMYYNDKSPLNRIKTAIFGGNLFLNALLIPDMGEVMAFFSDIAILAHAEYELLSLENIYFSTLPIYNTERFLLNSILVGGGVRQYIGIRSYMDILILWNISHVEFELPYTIPIIKFSINF